MQGLALWQGTGASGAVRHGWDAGRGLPDRTAAQVVGSLRGISMEMSLTVAGWECVCMHAMAARSWKGPSWKLHEAVWS